MMLGPNIKLASVASGDVAYFRPSNGVSIWTLACLERVVKLGPVFTLLDNCTIRRSPCNSRVSRSFNDI